MSKIANQKVEVPTGTALNEKDYSMLLLTNLKNLEKNYSQAMTEASNEWLYQLHRDVFLDIADLQRSVYEAMFLKGWYTLENVSQTKLDEAYNNIENDYNDLENQA